MSSTELAQSREHRTLIRPWHLYRALLVLLSTVFGAGAAFFQPLVTLGVVAVGSMSAVLLYYPFVGVLAYLVFEYARLAAMFPFLQALSIGKLIVVPTLLFWLIHWAVFKRADLVVERAYLPMAIWLLIAFAAAPIALNSGVAFDAAVDLAKWFVVIFLIMNIVNSSKKFQMSIWLLLLLNFKLSQHQIRAFMSGVEMTSNRADFIHQGVGAGQSFFGNGNDFGLAMAVVVPLAFYAILSSRSKLLKLAALVMTATFVVSLLNSGARGAAVALFATAFSYWLFVSRKKLVSLFFVAAFIAAFWSAAPLEWRERFITAKDYQEGTANQRIELWKAGIKMTADHPFLGVGIDNYRYHFQSSYRPADYEGAIVSHNILVQAASESGIGGLICVIALFIIAFKRNRETRRLCEEAGLDDPWLANSARALDLSLIAYFVGGMFVTVLYYPHFYILLGFVFALHQIVRTEVRQKTGGTVSH